MREEHKKRLAEGWKDGGMLHKFYSWLKTAPLPIHTIIKTKMKNRKEIQEVSPLKFKIPYKSSASNKTKSSVN